MNAKSSQPAAFFTKDKPVMVLLFLNVMLAGMGFLLTLYKLRSHDFQVPVQYVVHDGSILHSSQWYSLYSLAFFVVASTAIVIFLAHRLYKGNFIFSRGILAVQVIALVVALLSINAILGLVSRV